MAYLGQASLQPHARHIFRMAGQRVSGVLLLCRATPCKSAGFDRKAWMVFFLGLEFCGGPPGWGVGACRFHPAAGGGDVPIRVAPFRGPSLLPSVILVC